MKTGYLRESDRKAWVRYPPPRWIWKGTAIAAVPHEVSAAILHGWHGHNGISLDNPGLGFVCTGMTVDGKPGLEGYYFDYGRPLAEDERVRFAYDEEMPRIDWSTQPKLETANWPEERRLRTFRSYAMYYVQTMLPVLQDLLGPADARTEMGRVARLVGLQFHEETARELGLPTDVERGDAESARDFARWLSAILEAAWRGDRDGRERRRRHRDAHRLEAGPRAHARRSAARLRCLERSLARRRRGARPIPQGRDDALLRGRALVDRLAYRAEIARRQRMAARSSAANSSSGIQQVSRCSWLSTISSAAQRAGVSDDAHEARRAAPRTDARPAAAPTSTSSPASSRTSRASAAR